MKEIIYITKQSTKIKRKDNQIAVYENREKIWSFPINRIDKVFVFGNIEISMPAVNFLLSRNVDIYLLSFNGKFKGLITNTNLGSNYSLRLKQYRAFSDENKSLQTAKFFVLEKINAVEEYTGEDFSYYKKALELSDSYNEILGIEGGVSNIFFQNFRERLKDDSLGFTKREYRPAPDPVNALLSLIYSMFYSLLFSFLSAKGFDPYISFLHKKRGTHASLSSDFMEIFRVKLSDFVLFLFNRGIFSKDDFISSESSYYLKEESLKKFVDLFHQNFITDRKYSKLFEEKVNDFVGILS
ncbi:CRISPR-associated endonuclease Cas1 [Persephonella atlantica]|uniref:CRISPR-associated endonuclease Cas1 n=1 Tax=Persephonella atlantica TaxID=2699429 RepID=A0ABS1GI70_9AQUI|nr:CRISPR-associated endonuclease Cas1 [Persephonella atlantica]MBK3332639.1 CRISPR-associated endonuclease Cas1 [Persephonella atlantica]